MKQNAIRLLLILAGWCLASSVSADDWPQFLGKNRSGKSAEKGLIKVWPADGLKIDWRVKLGEGMSGISIVGDRLVTMFQDEKSQYVVCLKTSTGEKLWSKPVAPRYENSMGHGPRATPTIVDGTIYSYSGEGILTALNLEDGNIKWSVDCHQEFKAKHAEYGMSSSPLVLGDEVIVNTNPGKKGYSICAYSKDKGEFLWGTMGYPAGYSSPTVFEYKNIPFIVLFCGKALVGVEPVTGRAIWEYPFATEYNCNTASPVQVEGNLLISAGENHGSVLLSIESKNREDGPKSRVVYSVKEAWKSLGRQSSLRSEWQTPIYHDGFLYGFDNNGSAGPITNLVCVNAKTGEQQWIKRKFGKGNLIFADGKLILSSMKGELVVVKADPEKLIELGRQDVTGQTRQAPALANGKVYLRDNAEVVCVDLRE